MILVADDDPGIRKVILNTLALGEYESKLVENGRQVMEAVNETLPDLILMDVTMPKMTGIEACQKLRKDSRTVDIPIILISAQGDEQTMLKGLDGGADDYIVKPFQPAILLAKIRATLRGHIRRRKAGILHFEPGTIFDRRYAIQGPLGHGGMGVVYHATDLEHQREVAIKIQDVQGKEPRRFAQRFHREVMALAEIDHPNVVQIYSAGVYREHHYYSMQYIDGPSLRNRMDAQGILSPIEAFRIIAAVADGLGAVHHAGFVHRDVKPENIFLDSAGGVRIGDFGVVFPVEENETRLTLDGGLVGTPLYMSPEQLLSHDIDPRSDIYGLGAVLYEALSGHTIRDPAASAVEILGQAIQTPPNLLSINPKLPSICETLCYRACRPEPDDRFPNVTTFAKALRESAAVLKESHDPNED